MTEPADGPDEALRADIDRLVAGGEHAAAARAWEHAGYPALAGRVWEDIFEFDRAFEAYDVAGDARGALRVALKEGDEDRVDAAIIRATALGEARGLVPMLERQKRFSEIGKIHLAEKAHEDAARSFEKAGQLDRAARCKEELGESRAAGLLYEQHLQEHPGDAEAAYRLGRILARFSKHDEAIALFQTALRGTHDEAAMLDKVAPWLVLSFLNQSYPVAARAVLERWRKRAGPDQDVPATVEDFLASDRARALLMSKRHGTALVEEPDPASPDFFEVADKDDEEGALLLGGRYLLGAPLGGGGVGQVFRAFDALMDQAVAVKIFGSGAMGSKAVQAYAQDARASQAVGHVAIVPLIELNMDQGYVVSALCTGTPLEQRMKKGGDAGWLLPFTKALLHMLAACHRVGLVHGALKPTNLFTVPGGVRVVDFGAHHLLALRSTETGGLASVWPYLSPEQLVGGRATLASDVFSVGAILYRALSGRPAFADALDVRAGDIAPLTALRPGDGLEAWDMFLGKALAHDPADRFADASAMAEALPTLPPGLALPEAPSLDGAPDAEGPATEASRYKKDALVFRHDSVKAFEGWDLTLDRPVWLLEPQSEEAYAAYVTAGQLLGGTQPVFDLSPPPGYVVVARAEGRVAPVWSSLLTVPQGLFRDLSQVASALFALHQAGYALGGFAPERMHGPAGPRLRWAPFAAPVAQSPADIGADWQSFAEGLAGAFDLEVGPSLRTELLGYLIGRDLLSRQGGDGLVALIEAGQLDAWPMFLQEVADALVRGAVDRVAGQLADVVFATGGER